MLTPEHFEQSQPGKPEFKLILPSLPVPYEGVFEEVYMDYLDDPDRFGVVLEYKMETENPYVLAFFQTDDFLIPNPNISYKWAAIYYEIFARSSRKEGLPPLLVTDKTADTYFDVNKSFYEHAFDSGDKAGLASKFDEVSRRNRTTDESLSPELIKFWKSVDSDIASEREDGASAAEIFMNLHLLQTVQNVLRKQNDEYLGINYDITKSPL